MHLHKNFAFNGPLLEKYGIDISGVTSYETLEPVLKQIKEKAPDVMPFAVGKNFIPSENFDYPVAMVFHSSSTLKATLLRS